LVTNLTNKNYIQKEVESRLNSESACYYSVQNLLSSRLLSKNIKITIQRNIILYVVLLYDCETLFLTLREKCGLRMFAYKVLRKILWHERDEVRVKSKTA
jgi:hypothetical protein